MFTMSTGNMNFMDNIQWRHNLDPALLKPPPQVDPRAFNLYSFRWCDTEYSPRQLAELFEDYIPFLIMTTQGYLGRDEWMNAVASDEVYWLKEIAKEPRIVVKSENDGYFSIPLSYQHKVVPLKNGMADGAPTSIAELVESNKHIEFSFVAEKNRIKMDVCHGADSALSVNFGKIQIVDKYEERFLVVHCLSSGHLYPEACVLPIYMPVTVTIAVGLARSNHRDFLQTMMNMKRYIDSVPKLLAFPRQLRETCDILMYDEMPAEGEYDFLEPVKYVTLGKLDTASPQGYTTLVSGNDKSEGSSPELPPRVKYSESFYAQPIDFKPTVVKRPSKTKKSIEKDRAKGRELPAPPPGPQIPLDQRGGHRGQGSSINVMSRHGYHVEDIHPVEMLGLLKHTLHTGIIPKHIDFEEFLWTDSDDGQPEYLKKNQTEEQVYTKSADTDPAGLKNQRPAVRPRANSHKNKADLAPPTSLGMQSKPAKAPPPMPPPPAPPLQPSAHTAGSNFKGGLLEELQMVQQGHLRQKDQNAYGPEPVQRGASIIPSAGPTYEAIDEHQRTPIINSPFQYSARSVPQVPVKPLPPTAPAASSTSGQQRQPQKAALMRSTTHDGHNPSQQLNRADIRTINDIPQDIQSLDCKAIAKCLQFLKLDKYKKKLVEAQVDGALLYDMDADILQEDFGFKKFEALKLVNFARKGWRPGTNKASSQEEVDV